MCKVRIVHFSGHDVRVQVATQLFSAPGSDGGGDYTSTAIMSKCDCTHRTQELLEQQPPPANTTTPRRRQRFDPCPWHICCAIYYQAVLCQWYWDLHDDGGLAPEQQLGIESDCPNCFIVSEYYPIGMILDKKEEKEEGEVDEWVLGGKGGRELPAFLASDLFYSADLYDPGPPDSEQSYGLFEDRSAVQHYGEELWLHKAQLHKAISMASACLDSLEEELGVEDGLQFFAEDPTLLLNRVKIARQLVKEVWYTEYDAASAFKGIMRHAAFALAALHKMPREGESVTSADGSYSVSREQLDLGEVGIQAVIDVCDGPLKQVGELTARLQALKAVLQVPKRRQSRGFRNRRKALIPAMRVAKSKVSVVGKT
ncbi:hypothetical protein C8A00DRAFT_14615 [Chaetomidium leptoderma]|uniref:Uncharacterized protein n=1 Tax=Chaetomidium leptoderma TaxID=669021 RepID=A0AAN6ZZ51_9PEZI|nr:hypothetical protein C8A00DRAFT_14615 [Chaetomidium leptoderma]